MVFFEKEESIILPRETLEGRAIRRLIQKAKSKVKLELVQGVYQIPAWLAPAESNEKVVDTPFPRRGSK